MKRGSSDLSSEFVEDAGIGFHWAANEESRQEYLARSLQVLGRQRRIAERLAAFEREMQIRAARAAGESLA